MARIRSVHPGLFTDEAFLSLSMTARMFLIGLWTECDDGGAFEWKPITLKVRLMPADMVDVPALLAELEGADCIRRVTVSGKDYGLVRNFRRYQRPKKPQYRVLLTDELLRFVGQADANSESVENQLPTGGEKSPQMEDGGEDGGDSEPNGSGPAAVAPDPRSPRDKLFSEGETTLRFLTGMGPEQTRKLIGRLLQITGDDASSVIAAIEDADRERPAHLPSWLAARVKPFAKTQTIIGGPRLTPDQAIDVLERTGKWSDSAPVADISQLPADVLRRRGYSPDGRKAITTKGREHATATV